jgi:hypothetical protein
MLVVDRRRLHEIEPSYFFHLFFFLTKELYWKPLQVHF